MSMKKQHKILLAQKDNKKFICTLPECLTIVSSWMLK